MMETGTATSGNSVIRNLPRKTKTTTATSTKAIRERAYDFSDRRTDEDRGIEEYIVAEIGRKAGG